MSDNEADTSTDQTHQETSSPNKINKDDDEDQPQDSPQQEENPHEQQKNDDEQENQALQNSEVGQNMQNEQNHQGEEKKEKEGDDNQEEHQDPGSEQLNGYGEESSHDDQRSPSPSGYSGTSDGPPESPPPLTDPYPKQKLLVNPLGGKYICLKCKEILREPVKIKLCGHFLCYPCYEDVWSGPTPKCPEDQSELSDKLPIVDKNFRNEILQIEVKCQNHEHGCEWKGIIQDFVSHVELCEFIKMGCEYDCGAIILKCSKEEHIFRDCPKYYIRCPYCHDVILREFKKDHFRECEKLPLPCPNKCDEKTVAKNQMDDHIKYHCGRTKIMCKFEDVGCVRKTGREKMPDHYLAEAADHVNLLVDLDLKHRGLLNDILKRVEEHGITINERNIPRIGELEKMARTQLIWRIDDFQDKLRQAKQGDNDTLFYPPFTTSKHGYRLSASVCLNGDGKAKGTHMSMFISILKGPYDALLKWPFECRVSFTLLDQNQDPDNRKHINFSIKPSPCPENDPFLGRPKIEKNASFGCAEFAKHEEMMSRNYTDNDKLFLKIAVDWKCDLVPHP